MTRELMAMSGRPDEGAAAAGAAAEAADGAGFVAVVAVPLAPGGGELGRRAAGAGAGAD